MDIINDIKNALLPELILFIFIILNILLSLCIKNNTYKTAKIINLFAIIIIFISSGFIQINPSCYALKNVFVSNIYTLIFKLMIIVSAFFVIIASNNMIREKRKKSFEYFSVIMTGLLGAFSLISANDFLAAYVAMETLGLSCCLLAGFRKNHKSKEAAIKYLILSSAASLIFLFGVSYLYGITGSINITSIGDILINDSVNLLYVMSCLMIITGLLFKMGCIPFSNWIPDVYEGSSYSTCTYLSLIPKIAATAFISRIFIYIIQAVPFVQIIIAFLALITIIYASIGAIQQNNIKRLYAYSGIIHSGFIILTLSISSVYALSGVIFYLISYIFMNIGIWSASGIFSNEYNSDMINDYKGLFYKHPYFSSAIIICLLSLAGLPPTSGFISKLYIFTAIARGYNIYIVLLFLTMLSAVIGLCAYLKVIKALFEKQTTQFSFTNKLNIRKAVLYVCAFITILICIMPDILIKLSQICAYYYI